jgi:hypothetical protein
MNYDEHATQFMDSVRLMHLLQVIEEPWGFGAAYVANEKELRVRVERLNLPVYPPTAGKSNRLQVYYYDVILALTEFASARAIRKFTDKSGAYHGGDAGADALSRITAVAAKAVAEAAAHPHAPILMNHLLQLSAAHAKVC